MRRRVFRVRGNKVSKWNPCKNRLRVSVEEAITNLIAKFRVSSQLEVRTAGAVYQTLLLEFTGNKTNSQNLKSRASPAPQAKEERQRPMPWPKLLPNAAKISTQSLRASEPQSPRQATRPHQGSSSSSIFPSRKALALDARARPKWSYRRWPLGL